jgi:hypothetical protein
MPVRNDNDVISVMPPGFSPQVGRILDAGGAMTGNQDRFVGLDRFNEVTETFDQVEGVNSGPNPAPRPTSGGAKLLNPLREYASFNYRIELGSLSVGEINTPSTSYRSNGLSNMICRSGGGNLEKRATTFAEDTLGAHAEYYIEDFTMETVIAPNSNTGVAAGTHITFRIIEPYSMGQFIEALQVSAEQSGFKNYIEAPFCIKIDFIGHHDSGVSETPVQPKYIPIKMLAANFSIDGEGAKYECEAVPFNEQALESTLTLTKSDVSIQGKDVSTLLHQGEQSLTAVMNARNTTREQTQQTVKTDKYIIMFPTDPQGATKAVDGQRRQSNPLTANPFELNRVGASGGNSSVYSILDAYARSDVNEIGQSKIVLDPNEES